MVIFQVLFFSTAVLLLLYYFGYGVTRWLAQRRFASWQLLVMPLLGLALIVVWDYLALYFNLNLTQATWLLFGLVTAANLYFLVLALRHGRPTRAWLTALLPADTRRETLIVLGAALLAWFAAVAPLLRYGYITIIGENWDYENFLPLADYLRYVTPQTLAATPANPLKQDLLGGHIEPLPWAFSYLLATFNVFLDRQAIDLFAIALAIVRGASVAAAFLFCRVGLKLGARGSLIVTLLYAFNGLLLWFTYWNFGPHDTALAIMPLALAAGILALRERGAREIGFAALTLAALNLAFNPAFMLALFLLSGIGVYYLVAPDDARSWRTIPLLARERGRVLAAGVGMLALTLLLTFPLLLRLPDVYREYYAFIYLPTGLRDFVPLSEGYGLSLFTLDRVVGHTIPTPWLYAGAAQGWGILSVPVLLFMLGISVWGLIQIARNRVVPSLARGERATWFWIVGASIFYLALLRLPFLLAYPYGFLKALTLVSLPLLALFAQGITSLPTGPRVWVWVGRAGLAAVFAVVLLTFALSVEQYFKAEPRFFNADALRIREVGTLLPANARVLLTDRPEVQTLPMGLASYALMRQDLYGSVKTGYTDMNNAEAGAVYDYALLARGEDPTLRGYQTDALWSNKTFALYPRAAGVLRHQSINLTNTDADTLELMVDENGVVANADAVTDTPAERAVTLALATFVPQTLTLHLGDTSETYELAPGVTQVTFPRVRLPAALTVEGAPAGSLFMPYLQLREPASDAADQVHSDAMLVRCLGRDGKNATLDSHCDVVNPQGRALTWRWVVRGAPEGTREERVAASAQLEGSPRRAVSFPVDETRSLEGLQFDDLPLTPLQSEKIPPGTWRISIEIADARSVLARFEVVPQWQISPDDMTWRAGAGAPVIIQP